MLARLKAWLRAELKELGIKHLIKEWQDAYTRLILVELEETATPDVIKEIEEIKRPLDPDSQKMDSLLAIEFKGIAKLDGPSLDARIESQLESYRRLAGDTPSTIWESKKAAIAATNTLEKQVFLKRLTKDTFRIYLSLVTMERIKAKLLGLTSILAIIVTLILAELFWWWHEAIWLILLAALWGAFLSIFQRISSVSNSAGSFKNLLSLIHAPFGIVVSIGVGMLSPFIAIIIINTGTLHGSLLPRVDQISSLWLPYNEYEGNYWVVSETEYDRHTQIASSQPGQRADTSNVKMFPPEDLEHFANINFDRNFAKLLLLSFFCGFSANDSSRTPLILLTGELRSKQIAAMNPSQRHDVRAEQK